jgi:DNA repair exonuclease SbcCD ATPase subunit
VFEKTLDGGGRRTRGSSTGAQFSAADKAAQDLKMIGSPAKSPKRKANGSSSRSTRKSPRTGKTPKGPSSKVGDEAAEVVDFTGMSGLMECEECKQLGEEMRALKDLISKLKGASSGSAPEQQDELVELRTQLSKLQDDLAKAKAVARSKTTQLTHAKKSEAKADAARSSNVTLKADVKDVRRQLKEQTAALAEAQADRDAARQERDSLAAKNSALTSDAEKADGSATELEEVQQQLAKSKHQALEVEAQLEAQQGITQQV